MLTRFIIAATLALACAAECRAAQDSGNLSGDFAVAPVARQVRVNGLPLEISAISTGVDPQRACALIAKRWAGVDRAAVIGCRNTGSWMLVTRRVGRWEQTAQLRASPGGAAGYLSQIDLGTLPARSPVPLLPLPAGARVLSALQSIEPNAVTVQFAVSLPLSPAATVQQLSAAAAQHRWEISSPAERIPAGRMLEFRRGAVDVQVIVSRIAGGSGMVLVEHHAEIHQP